MTEKMNDANRKWQQIIARIPKAHKSIFSGSQAEIGNIGLVVTLVDSGADMAKIERLTTDCIQSKVDKIFGGGTKINYQKPLPSMPQPEPQPERIKIINRRKPRYFTVDNELFDHGHAAVMKPSGLSVYLCLCRHADFESNDCFPSYATIAKKCGVTRQTAITHIKRLAQLGYLEIEHNFNSNGDSMSNTFFILELPNIESS